MARLFSLVWKLFTSIYLFIYHSITFLEKGDVTCQKSKYIISLTTYGERIKLLHLTLESLLRQSVQPHAIIVWLSTADFPDRTIPRKILLLKERGVQVRFVDENIKSYKKIIYTYLEYKDYKDMYIVTADDDVYYPKDWLKGFTEHTKKKKRVFCYRAKKIAVNTDGELLRYSSWVESNQNSNKIINLPTGVSGVCYPMESLYGVDNKEVFLRLCSSADDVWLKFVTLKNGFSSELIGSKSRHFPPVTLPFNRPQKGLEIENVINDKNRDYFLLCMDHFGFDIKEFIE